MLEILEELEMDPQGLLELHQQHDCGKKDLAELTDTLKRLHSEAKARTELLKSLNTKYAVIERHIQESRNEIFLIKSKCTEVAEDFPLLQNRFEKRQNQLEDLRREKRTLSDRIAEIERQTNGMARTQSRLAEEKQALSQKLEEQNAVKQAITEEISQALDKTSLDREDVEKKLNELNTVFLHRIDERNAQQMRLSAVEAGVDDLAQQTGELEGMIAVFEELDRLQANRKTLDTEIEKLRSATESIDSKIMELEDSLAGKKEQFDKLEESIQERAEAVVALEKEVSKYEKALAKQAQAKEKRAAAFEASKQVIQRLSKLFVKKAKLEIELLKMKDAYKAIDEIVESTG